MNVPKLRFKDDNGREFSEWSEKPLQEVCKINQGLQIPISERFTDKGDGRHFYITNEFLKKDSTTQYFIENPPSSVLCTESDVLMTRTGNTGKVVTGVNGAFHNNFFKINFDKAVLNKIFLCEFLSREKTQFLILKLAGTSTIPDLNHSDFYKITMQFPSLPEQTKIAHFLTAIDEKISQLTQKYDLLKQYKKGVMQQIFSQTLRFKDDDGREFSEWEEKAIGDIFTFIQTNSFSRELLNYETGTIKNIHYGDIHTKFRSNFKIENENVPFINLTVDISKVPDECYCRVGDLVIADASEDYADVGKAIEIINLGNEQLLSGLHTYIARDLSNQMAIGFSGYLMQSEAVRLQIKTLANGVSVLSISKGNLAKVKIRLPLKSEQTKIANFLTAIDDKITHTKTQLDAVKLYKKGLLQQMFV